MLSFTSNITKIRPPIQRLVRSISSHSNLRFEYFVMVWDKPGADRNRLTHANDFPESFTFAGEMLEHDSPTARGNCLTCNATSIEDVESQLRLTQYFKKGVWDISTAKISPLETVHTSDYVE